MRLLPIAILLAGFSSAAPAATLYVSDQLEITLRKGTSTSHGIVRMVPSGTALEVLETDKASGYTRVRTPAGAEGWALSRYLMAEAPARQRVQALEKRLADMEAQNQRRSESLQDANADNGELDQARAELEKENQRLEQELAEIRRTASSALAIASENQEMKKKAAADNQRMQMLQQENLALRDSTARDWFVIGGGVLLLGLLLGLIIPRLSWRKKSSWGSL